MNRKYELVYVVSPDATDAQVAELHTQVEQITQRLGGKIDKTDNWGRRKLAYEIGPHKEGTYVLEVITGSGDMMKEIDRRLRVSDQVIRHLTVRVDEENRTIERTRTLRPFPFHSSNAAPAVIWNLSLPTVPVTYVSHMFPPPLPLHWPYRKPTSPVT